ncbi:MAG: hypothetical protein RLZZ519_2564 [Bacteroidota bacterium]|jgi:hypothetical protein
MKALNTTTLTTLKSLFFALCISVVAFSCEKECIRPEGSDLGLQESAFPFVSRPSVQCGPSSFASLKDGASTLGSVEVLNNSTDLYVIFDLNQFKYLEEVKIFAGDGGTLPLDSDGNVDTESFNNKLLLSSPANDYTLVLPLSSMPTCSDIVIWARVTTRNIWGQVTGTNYTWMSGNAVANAFKMSYCATSCITGNSNNSSTI